MSNNDNAIDCSLEFLHALWSKLRCCKCSKVVREPPISLCSSNHLICRSCSQTLNNIGNLLNVCRANRCTSSMSVEGQTYLENILLYIALPCLYRENGCRVARVKSKLDEHFPVCSYREFTCPIMNCSTIVSKNSFLHHVTTSHNSFLERCALSSALPITNFYKKALGTCSVWDILEWGTFYFRREYDATTNTTFKAIQFVGTTEEASNFGYTITEEGKKQFAHFTGIVEPIAFSKWVITKRKNAMITCGRPDGEDVNVTIFNGISRETSESSYGVPNKKRRI